MNGNWIKIAFFVLGAVMLAGITQVLLDPGLGTPDETRRTRHPAGFSFLPPRGWGASVFYAHDNDHEQYLRVSPERSTGAQPSIGVKRFLTPSAISPDATPFTFQGKPAFRLITQTKHAWVWRIDFVRDEVSYEISYTAPVPADVETGPFWPFIEGFRVETPLAIKPTAPLAGESPTTAPTSNPVTPMLPTTSNAR